MDLWKPRHSFCSRILHSCISSKLYNGEKTLRDINAAWADEMASLYHEGFQARGLLFDDASYLDLYTFPIHGI